MKTRFVIKLFCTAVVISSCSVVTVQTVKLPSFMMPCSMSNTEINKCIERSAQLATKMFSKGLPDLGVPPLDPVKLDKISINVPGLNVLYEDTLLTGLGDSKISKVKFNLDKYTLKLEFAGNLTLRGKYRIKGRVLILPIEGNGRYVNKLTNMRMVLKHKIGKTIGKDGEEHWSSELIKRTFDVDRASFDYSNLFGGNRLLGDTTLRFLNDNWEVIMREISPPAVDQIVQAIIDATNKFYENVPAKEFLLP